MIKNIDICRNMSHVGNSDFSMPYRPIEGNVLIRDSPACGILRKGIDYMNPQRGAISDIPVIYVPLPGESVEDALGLLRKIRPKIFGIPNGIRGFDYSMGLTKIQGGRIIISGGQMEDGNFYSSLHSRLISSLNEDTRLIYVDRDGDASSFMNGLNEKQRKNVFLAYSKDGIIRGYYTLLK